MSTGTRAGALATGLAVLQCGLPIASVGCASSSPAGPSRPPGPSAPPGTTGAAPPASAGHSLVYAAHLGMVVLVNAGLGGMAGPDASTPTRVWGWTGAEWRLLDSGGPPARNLAGVAYDRRRQTLVMHGGTDDLGRSYGETWEWSSGWRQVAGAGPGVRDHTQLAYDPERGRAVLFGGSGADPNAAFPDTWEFDGTTWARVAATGPPGRVHHAMQYDPAVRRVVLFGGIIPGAGSVGDTWTWDGSTWTRAPTSAMPRSHARMAFDSRLGGLLLVGGLPPSSDMLVNRGGAWTPLSPPTGPSARYLTDLAYDESRGVMVLFGGGDPGGMALFDDTWEFDGTTWRRVR